MDWFDNFQKLLSIMVNILKLREYYKPFKQWLRSTKQQKFWLALNHMMRLNPVMRLLVNLHTAALIIFLGLTVAVHWEQNYSPLMPAVGLIHLCWFIFGGLAVSGLTIKGLWHYNMKLANL